MGQGDVRWMMRHNRLAHCIKLELSYWLTGTLGCCAHHVYLSHRLNTRSRNEASADLERKHSDKRLKTGRR
ncbi:hypothetical protein NQZ68_001546 [Dissostichus eleginoides]|nr:hypothetical protein NQZ68_001546 [Dissostichus eleginoides]